MFDYLETEMNYKDCMTGRVVGSCQSGIFIKLENGETAYSRFNHLPNGTTVLCTLLRKAKNKKYAYVGIDSVIKDYLSAA